MERAAETPSDNLVRLDLSPFPRADLGKIEKLGDKQRLLHRWFRSERITADGCDTLVLYSGARGRTPYAAYRVERRRDGGYVLLDQRSGEELRTGRTLDEVLDALPEDFFYSG